MAILKIPEGIIAGNIDMKMENAKIV